MSYGSAYGVASAPLGRRSWKGAPKLIESIRVFWRTLRRKQILVGMFAYNAREVRGPRLGE
jgi:hypothetical protein